MSVEVEENAHRAASEDVQPFPDRERLLAEFFARLRQAARSVLMLDYDGTLAPFRVERDQAFPYPGVAERLRSIADCAPKTRLAVVSGRPAEEIVRLLGVDGVEIWGAHGWERLHADGRLTRFPLPADVKDALEQAHKEALQLLPHGRIEKKYASVAAHVRGLPDQSASEILERLQEAWGQIARGRPLELRPFDGGLELRATGRTKGDVVLDVLREEGPGVPVAYLGDDITDEDAFQALNGKGLAVLVRPECRRTHARLWIRPPEELLGFLEEWLKSVRGKA